MKGRQRNAHFTEIYYFLLASCGVNLNNGQWSANSESAIENINTQNDGIALTERCNNLQTTGPDSLRSSVFPLGFSDLIVVSLERVKQVIDNVG